MGNIFQQFLHITSKNEEMILHQSMHCGLISESCIRNDPICVYSSTEIMGGVWQCVVHVAEKPLILCKELKSKHFQKIFVKSPMPTLRPSWYCSVLSLMIFLCSSKISPILEYHWKTLLFSRMSEGEKLTHSMRKARQFLESTNLCPSSSMSVVSTFWMWAWRKTKVTDSIVRALWKYTARYTQAHHKVWPELRPRHSLLFNHPNHFTKTTERQENVRIYLITH